MNLEIANRLVRLRKERGFSQEELAARIGSSRQAVSKWERAEAAPDTDNLILLSRLYGVSLDELLKTDGEVESRRDDPVEAAPSHEQDDEDEGDDFFWSRFPYPVAVTVLYLLLGVSFGLWHPGWILFVTIPLYYWIVEEVRRWKRK